MSKSAWLPLFMAAIGITIEGCARTQKHAATLTTAKPVLVERGESEGLARLDDRTAVTEPKPSRRSGVLQAGGSEEIVDFDASEGVKSTSAESDMEPRPLSSAMTLADLEAMALQYNPTLSQAAAGVDQERGVYRQAGLYPNPQLGFLNTTANQSDPKQSNGMFFSQEFVTAHKLSLEQQASAETIKRLEWDQQAQHMRVLNDLKTRYLEVLGAQEAVKVAQQLQQLAEETLDSANKLFEAKTVSKSDVLQANIQLETTRINLAEAMHRHQAAWEQLVVMVGAPHMQPVTVVGDLDNDLPTLDQEACWQRLLSESPQLRAAEAELDQGRAALRTSEAQAIPNVTLQTIADYDRISHSTTVSTLVALPVPFFNRNQGNIDKAMADIQVDQADIARVQLVLRDMLADSFRRYQTSRVQAERLKQSILPDSDENLKLTKEAFQGGEVAFREVLSAQQAFVESRLAYIEAQTELQKVVAEIEGLHLSGGLNPAAIGSAIQSQPGGTTQRQRALLNEVNDRAAKQLLPAAQIGR